MTAIMKNQPTPSDHEVLTGEPRDPVESIASGTDWTRAGITGATARNMIEDALRASLTAIAGPLQGR